ncbi:DUF3363 domain-containing protein [Bradyrhizobium sp. BR 1433]|uniref:DUF3363 domain-containing protein n=1 Tax=Bradyrhizobium sp. BR 1433 TaxID=3447967 RepID=UPI003EE616E4
MQQEAAHDAPVAIFDPEQGSQRLVGRVVREGFSDELRERRYVVLDGVDGWTHYDRTSLGCCPG